MVNDLQTRTWNKLTGFWLPPNMFKFVFAIDSMITKSAIDNPQH